MADNTKHAFNEFIKLAVEFGVFGLVVLLGVVVLLIRKSWSAEQSCRQVFLAGMSAFLVLAFFSYPLQYPPIWVLLAYYVALLFSTKVIVFKCGFRGFVVRGVVIGVCGLLLFKLSHQLWAEMKWKEIATKSLRGQTEEMLPEYEVLYKSLHGDAFFLYNYGAELNYVGRYEESTRMLEECRWLFNDYDLQMLLADNQHKMGNEEEALAIYQYASCMIPCRFLPIYRQFEIHKDNNQVEKSCELANELVRKQVKVPSYSVDKIKKDAESYLNKKTYE